MADDDKKKDQPDSDDEFAFPSEDFKTDGGEGGEGEGGLGNLPPLSDFESASSDRDEGDLGGLPPLSDLEESEPQPTGGRIRQPESDFRPESSLDTPTPAGFDTPPGGSPGSGFQNIGADSDFSPETPEIGPGPDSDIETPMFDSAFGGQDSGFDTPMGGRDRDRGTPATGAPTQAMETPMFGESPSGGGLGFDDDAFGLGGGGGAPGSRPGDTPAPDFGADTHMSAQQPVAAGPPPRGGGVSPLVAVIVLIVGGLLGLLGGQFVNLPLFPDASQQRIDELTQQNLNLQNQLQRATADPLGTGEGRLSQEEIDQLIQEKDRLTAELVSLQDRHAAAEEATVDVEERFALRQAEFDQLSADYAETRMEYEQLQDAVSIISARQEGLLSEVDRLTGLVGQLEDADQRRIATKEALAHGIQRLQVTVREGMPLTPERFARNQRLARVEQLTNQVGGSNWVDPDMMREYTSLFLKELEIAESREYFYARIPVEDRYGGRHMKWAECLMNGNWSVYYRTLDGKHIGIYENVGTAQTPEYAFVQFLPAAVEKSIETQIVNSRTPGWEEKVRLLADKQELITSETEWQRWFSSL
jgi:hypothetical protein